MALASIFLAAKARRAQDLDPQHVGSWPGYSRGLASAVAVSSNYAFVAAAGQFPQLATISLSQPRRSTRQKLAASFKVTPPPSGFEPSATTTKEYVNRRNSSAAFQEGIDNDSYGCIIRPYESKVADISAETAEQSAR